MHDEDARAIARVRGGEKEAFGELVRKYSKRAYSLAYRLTGSHQDAEDISQEAFVRAYKALGGFKGNSEFYTWFYRILVNLCMKAGGRRFLPLSFFESSEDGQSLEETVPDTHARTPREMASEEEVARKIRSAVMRLPRGERTAFSLVMVEGMKIREAAGVMQCRPGTVKSHLFRATRKLRQWGKDNL